MPTANRNYPTVSGVEAPDVPLVVNRALNAIDADVESLSQRFGPALPDKCVRREAGAWVWVRAGATHYLIPDHTGALVVRPTPYPIPDAAPSLTW